MAKKADLRTAMLTKAAESASRRPATRSRAGKSNVTGYFEPEVKKQLRLLAVENDTTIQNLLAEALNDLFAKYGKPELALIKKQAR